MVIEPTYHGTDGIKLMSDIYNKRKQLFNNPDGNENVQPKAGEHGHGYVRAGEQGQGYGRAGEQARGHKHDETHHNHENAVPHSHENTHSHDDEAPHSHASTHGYENGVPHSHACGVEHSHENAHTHTKAVLNRLSRLIGHLNAVRTMVEQGRDCPEVLIQLAAVRAATTKVCEIILKDHLEHCIVEAVNTGDKTALDEMNRAVELLMK